MHKQKNYSTVRDNVIFNSPYTAAYDNECNCIALSRPISDSLENTYYIFETVSPNEYNIIINNMMRDHRADVLIFSFLKSILKRSYIARKRKAFLG